MHGWVWKVVWEVGPNYRQSVMLRGGNVYTGVPLWFNFDLNGADTLNPILDPSHPGHPVSQVGDNWSEWGSYIYIPAAGCYYLEATWPQGHWRIVFAAGT